MSDRFTEEKQSVPIDVQQIKKESEIYKDLKPGSFLYEYRSKLNDAAFSIALDNPAIILNKGTLIENAKRKVEDDGYMYKKKKSRSSTVSAPQPEKSLKMKPSIRAKQLAEISEDLEEVKKEIFHLERSREKARNLNSDERALRLTKEMDPLRIKKRRLEEELSLLQKKEKKSSKDKERRQRASTASPPAVKHGTKPSSCQTGSLDLLLKRIEGKGQSSKSSSKSSEQVEDGEACGRREDEGHSSSMSSEQVQGGETSGRREGEGQSSSESSGQVQKGEACGRREDEGHSSSMSSEQVKGGETCGRREGEGQSSSESSGQVQEGEACGGREGEGRNKSSGQVQESEACGRREGEEQSKSSGQVQGDEACGHHESEGQSILPSSSPTNKSFLV